MNDGERIKATLKSYAIYLILAIGIIMCIWPVKDNNDLKTILLSIGCSLIATSVTTFIMQPTENTFENTLLKEQTKVVLGELGIDIPMLQRENRARSFPACTVPENLGAVLDKELEQIRIEAPHQVGQHGVTTLKYYIDLIGASCNPDTSVRFARLLSTYWRQNSANPSIVHNSEFDFVVTPKGGSPLLGYEFAKLCNKPFVLHEQKERLHGDPNNMRAMFNFAEQPPSGSTAIIVDDSTTGGTMVMKAAEDLVKYGYRVHTCLVVFAPQVKQSSEVLRNSRVPLQLVPMKKTHLPED